MAMILVRAVILIAALVLLAVQCLTTVGPFRRQDLSPAKSVVALLHQRPRFTDPRNGARLPVRVSAAHTGSSNSVFPGLGCI
jgi:hypothetical protein